MPSPGRGPDSIVALDALRRARRRRRTESVDVFETLYQAYLAAVLSAAAVFHLLLAPVDRRRALRPAVYARLRSGAGVAAAVAAAAGAVAGRRLPGGTLIAARLLEPSEGAVSVDEPFVGLDAVGRRVLPELMDPAAGEGASVIVATREIEYAGSLPRCISLRDGRVVSDGAPSSEALAELGKQS